MIKFCKNVRADSSLKQEVLHLLPPDVNGLVVKVQQESRSFFSFTLRLEISTKDDALAWVKLFEHTTLTSYKVNHTFAENTQKIVFKKNFHCHHNTRPKSSVLKPHEKHTKCRAKINIVIKPQMKRSQDPYLEEYPCEVYVNWCHNHTIDYEALKYRSSDELSSTFAGYYANGHSPISALELHKIKLQTEYGQDFYKVAADGARCPNKIWCYKLYYKIFHRTCRDLSSGDTLNALTKYIQEYNEKCGEAAAAMSKDMATSDVVVAICSPLCRRVLTLPSVREIMFVTSSSARCPSSQRWKRCTGAGAKLSCRVTLLLAPSVAGALPLGVIVTTGNREVLITQGMEMVKELLRDPEFGPKMIISDDNEPERNSLMKIFPLSAVLLSKTHVLQAMWRYLSDSKHNLVEHKPSIFAAFSALLHSSTKQAFDEQWVQLSRLPSVQSNPHLNSYLEGLKEKELEWALYARLGMLVRNKHTYANSEVSIRLLKAQFLHRTKSFNILQLVDTMTSALTGYYATRLLNCVTNRAQSWESRYYMPAERIQGLEYSQSSEGEYIVRHPKGEEYLVNHEIGACTCAASTDGTLCSHQYGVLVHYNLDSDPLAPSKDVLAKKHLYYIATGEQLADNEARWCGTRLLHPQPEPKIGSRLLHPQSELLKPKIGTSLSPKTELHNTQTLTPKVEMSDADGDNVAEATLKQKRGKKARIKETQTNRIEECRDEEGGDDESGRESGADIGESKRIVKKKGNYEKEEDENRLKERRETHGRTKLNRSARASDCDDGDDDERVPKNYNRQCSSKVKNSKKKPSVKEFNAESDDSDKEDENSKSTKKSKRKVLPKGAVESTKNKPKKLKITKCDSSANDTNTDGSKNANAKQTPSQSSEEMETNMAHIGDTDAESEEELDHLILTDTDVDDEHIEYIHCNEQDDTHSQREDKTGDSTAISDRDSSSRRYKKKVKDGEQTEMGEDLNDADADEDDTTLDANEFLSQDYTSVLSDVYNQTMRRASTRDADIEKELLHEELKDMIRVVPARIVENESEDQQKSRESEKEAMLARLADMFRITGEKLIHSYDLYKPAVEAMVSAFESIKSDSGVLAAFHAFGKTNSGIKKSDHVAGASTKRKVVQSFSTAAGLRRNAVEDRKQAVHAKRNAVVGTVWTSPGMKGHVDPSVPEDTMASRIERDDNMGDDNTAIVNNKQAEDASKGKAGSVKRYSMETTTGTGGIKRHAIGVVEEKARSNKKHTLPQSHVSDPGQVIVAYNIAPSVDGTYAYLDEGLYSMVIDSNSELQDT